MCPGQVAIEKQLKFMNLSNGGCIQLMPTKWWNYWLHFPGVPQYMGGYDNKLDPIESKVL